MLMIPCPFCGPRNESEFAYGGPATPRRPDDPAAVGDADWVDYLTVPDNPVGPVRETWWHRHGCGRWVTITRHTVSHEILDEGHDDGR